MNGEGTGGYLVVRPGALYRCGLHHFLRNHRARKCISGESICMQTATQLSLPSLGANAIKSLKSRWRLYVHSVKSHPSKKGPETWAGSLRSGCQYGRPVTQKIGMNHLELTFQSNLAASLNQKIFKMFKRIHSP